MSQHEVKMKVLYIVILVGCLIPYQRFNHDSDWWALHHIADVMIAAFAGAMIAGRRVDD